MKKYLLFAFISIFFLYTKKSFAQKSVDIGFKAGISIPDLTGGNDANPINSGYGSRLGMDDAIFAELHL